MSLLEEDDDSKEDDAEIVYEEINSSELEKLNQEFKL